MNPRHLSFACVAVLSLAASACDSNSSECGEPVYVGRATDEAWRALVDAKQRPADSSLAVTLVSPSEGQLYATEAAPPRWEWTSPLRASLDRPRSGALALAPPPRSSRSFTAWLGELLLPTAHAHGTPFTGDIYWVEVSTPGSKCPVAQVLTPDLSWQLDANTWAELGKNGNAFSLQVTSAYLQENRVTEGPYTLPTPRTFRRGAR
ncbi:MAG TPA: hypothetical protein VF794_28940 [Archangium sp.]|jgi:hypothetical protein|uniref:hypothetical protein n=1 Tax=Archangium sp. TaxID=1872627 RepID=UPI002ED97E91